MIERLFGETAVAPASDLWVWRLLFPPVRFLVSLFARIEVVGREHVPTSGPYIIVANHINWKDPPAVSIALGTPIRWMAKIEVFDYPLLGFLLRGIGNFSIRRGESDRRAIALALRVLAKGLPLGVFPEGHRSERGALLRGQPGISLLAERTDAPIVPCAIVGTPRAMPHIPRRTEITLRFGRPFRVSELPAEVRRDRQATADAIMTRIAELLPREMRGAYAEAVDRPST
ncbi:MAG TPA: lysophospholipid acyltransferase family protein [Candidatus Limnocylindria bacterium]|nr:lysophospholipid acyltransferase family protein [Candidatus Limnocylindria bacterium]